MAGFNARSIRFDRGAHFRAKLGFVLLASEQTIEDDVMRLRPDGVGVHFTRSPLPNAVTVANLRAMIDDMARAAATLVPDAGLDVACYACTSGTVVIGEERCLQELARGAPAAKPATLAGSCVAALRVLQARRVAVATPYLDEINEIEAAFLEARGIEVAEIVGLNIRDDSDIVRVAPEYIAEFARSVDRPDADAVFISCGALRTLDLIDALEQDLGKPVVTSNQAMMWHCLRLAGVDDRVPGYGRLFREF